MSTLKARLIAEVIAREGGDKFVDHPADRGGPTRFGITEETAREHGYTGDMRKLPRSFAEHCYATKYWHSLALDQVVTYNTDLAESLFDYGIHSHPTTAGRELQGILNLLNRIESDYPDIEVDGLIGPETFSALSAFGRIRGAHGLDLLSAAVNARRIDFLFGLAEQRESQEAFSYGWLERVVALGRGRHG